MKKNIFLFVLLGLFAVSLSGCGDTDLEETSTSVPPVVEEATTLENAYFYSYGGASQATFNFTTGKLVVLTAPPDGSDWQVNLAWHKQSVVLGEIYRVTFACTSVPVNNVRVEYKQLAEPNDVYGTKIAICNGNASIDITATATDNVAVLYINFLSAGTYTLGESVKIQKVGSVTIDTTPPTLTSFMPDKDQINVSVATKVTATFSESMKVSSVNNNTFCLLAENTPINGEVVMVGETATFTPSASLTDNTTYTVMVDGAEDLAGNKISKSWSFTTAPAVQPPAVPVLQLENAYFYSYGGPSQATFDDSTGRVVVTTAPPEGSDWQVNLAWHKQSVISGKIYRVTFACNSIPVNQVGVVYKQLAEPYEVYGTKTATCNGNVSVDITASATDNVAALYINFLSAGTYTLGDLTVTKVN